MEIVYSEFGKAKMCLRSDSFQFLKCTILVLLPFILDTFSIGIPCTYIDNFSEPRTTILGNKELFIEAGSTINLTCIIQAGTMRDTHIFWNYDGKVSSLFCYLSTTKFYVPNSCKIDSRPISNS